MQRTGQWNQRTAEARVRDIQWLVDIDVPIEGADGTITYVRYDLFDALGKGGRNRVLELVQAHLDRGDHEAGTYRCARRLRKLSHYLVADPLLEDDTDLNELYGPLTVPLFEREFGEVRHDVHGRLPKTSEIPELWRLGVEWSATQPNEYVAMRSVVALILGMLLGWRPGEARLMRFGGSEGVMVYGTNGHRRIGRIVYIIDIKPPRPGQTKQRIRPVELPPMAKDILDWYLREWYPGMPTAGATVFPGSRAAERPMTGAGFDDGLERVIAHLHTVCDLLDPKMTPHWMRKVFATNYLRDGGHVLKLMALGGSTSINALRSYIGAELVDGAQVARRDDLFETWCR